MCACLFPCFQPCRYIPSNFARREKRSLLDKIISKRAVKKQIISNGHGPNSTGGNHERILSLALVKFRYDADRYVIESSLDKKSSTMRVCLFSEDEISLNKGVWINVLQKKNDGWWLIQYEKQRGWFPSNYLIEVTVLFTSACVFTLSSIRVENIR